MNLLIICFSFFFNVIFCAENFFDTFKESHTVNGFLTEALWRDDLLFPFYLCTYTSDIDSKFQENILMIILSLLFKTRCHAKCIQIMENICTTLSLLKNKKVYANNWHERIKCALLLILFTFWT